MSGIDDLPPLRDVIRQHDLSARKSLGQNFLLDLNLTARIARAAGPLEDATVIEIPYPGGNAVEWRYDPSLGGYVRFQGGVQEFDPTVQAAINRIQPPEMVARTVDWLRQSGVSRINFDLIYGLPHQTLASFERTIRGVLTFGPDRIAVFNYAHVPWLKPHQKPIQQSDLPSPEEKLDILKMTIELLT